MKKRKTVSKEALFLLKCGLALCCLLLTYLLFDLLSVKHLGSYALLTEKVLEVMETGLALLTIFVFFAFVFDLLIQEQKNKSESD